MVSSANYNLAITPNVQSQIKASNPLKFNEHREESEKPKIIQKAKIKYHKIKQSDKYSVQGEWDNEYIIKVECQNPNQEIDKNMSELMSRYKLITFKFPQKTELIYLKNCYKLDQIISPQRNCGAGTSAVQALLERSLADKETEGRIVLYSEIIDGETSPAGFFYKLGFRFVDNSMNDIMNEWILKKSKDNSPKLTGMMYLPRANINKVMMYKMKYM